MAIDGSAQPALGEQDKKFALDEKIDVDRGDLESIDKVDFDSNDFIVLENERDLVTHVIGVADDPSLNPWTLRAFIIGIGLSAFGGVLAEIYYFKAQTVLVSTMFLAVISYVMGMAFDAVIPTHGIFRYLNPHPFNKKENAFLVIMASAAANSALGTEVLAVQRLFYNIDPNSGASIFLLFSSQLLGYGIGDLSKSVLLDPSKMLYPEVLPLASMFDALYKDAAWPKKRLRVFWIVSGVIFIWELFPEWMFPLLTGLSVFCLANPSSQDFTRIFGGSNGNEGLGLLSICFDWQYISRLQTRWLFLSKLNFLGTSSARSSFFPKSFYANGTVYDHLRILNDKLEVDPASLEKEGLPFYAGSWVVQLLTTNLGMAATSTHLLLWNRNDLRNAWTWMKPTELKRMWDNFNWKFWRDDGMREERDLANEDIDPHYREMLKYADAPNSWYLVTLAVSVIVGLVVIYTTDSTLPWWGFLIAILLSTMSILSRGSLFAITGLQFIIQPFVQMIGGFIHPGKPMANMYFVLFSYNSVIQAQLLMRDLEIAQYTKLPPRAAFTAHILGTLFGAVLNFVLMNSIIDNQRDILLSVEGTHIWSGQQLQQYNSQAIAWGGSSFSLSDKDISSYSLLGLITDYLYTPVICYYIGWLCFSQWWLRTRYPKWFAKYDYIVAAALDGGTQVMVFILSFAVHGASGDSHLYSQWWGGANQDGNCDRRAVIPS
ncbi:putative oligopeptide transporter [Lyophyllum shimeji]|uniref:Oligopeptide transporter n=1 Tax=Lyophyllum shimeji TaxID=47721 RepID=A0A9P3UMC5_LYOSH|nr:putative oligopeptide transporter [Lyophyllum shimeji]